MYSIYYDLKANPRKYWGDALNARDSRGEQIHQGMITGEAHKFIRVMPALEWLYFGQLPMGVRHSARKNKMVVEVLSSERDECWTLLQNMFHRGAE